MPTVSPLELLEQKEALDRLQVSAGSARSAPRIPLVAVSSSPPVLSNSSAPQYVTPSTAQTEHSKQSVALNELSQLPSTRVIPSLTHHLPAIFPFSNTFTAHCLVL